MRFAIRIILVYLLFSVLWAALSNRVADWLPGTAPQPSVFPALNGILFVLASALLLFWMIFRELQTSGRVGQERHRAPLTAATAPHIAIAGTPPQAGSPSPPSDLIHSHDLDRAAVERLKSLRRIDTAIASTFDLPKVLGVVLEQATSQLKVDAACVLLLDAEKKRLQFVEGRGFRTDDVQWASVGLGDDWAGKAALERTVIIRPLEQKGDPREFRDMVRDEGFATYLAVPLIAKDKVVGVLEIYHRSPLAPVAEWLDFLQTLAGQTAIAIENALLFSHLEQTNAELIRAYDRTLEGWSHALELRDIETHGHARRVTETTVLLARAAGFDEADLVHVRRGALLHDIGKLAIPDRILLKAGPLSDGEWEIMSLHPLYAHELLSPIPFLEPALDIPFMHHEWWDGTGYPRGIQKDEISLAARVFAIVDVVDALCSVRPYCERWPKEKVLDYIREQSGRQFDPELVDLFFERSDEIFALLEAQTAAAGEKIGRVERFKKFVRIETIQARPRDERTPIPANDGSPDYRDSHGEI